MLDDLARAVARQHPREEAIPERLSRGTLVRRGLLGALAVGVAGGVRAPESAAVQLVCPYGSLPICLGQQSSAYRRNLDECSKAATPVDVLACYRSSLKAWDYGREVCREKCPKPKPPPKKPPMPAKKPPSQPSPPPLPPNPYDRLLLQCSYCAKAGGKCCYGGKDPTTLCMCGNPGLPCSKKYGCTG